MLPVVRDGACHSGEADMCPSFFGIISTTTARRTLNATSKFNTRDLFIFRKKHGKNKFVIFFDSCITFMIHMIPLYFAYNTGGLEKYHGQDLHVG